MTVTSRSRCGHDVTVCEVTGPDWELRWYETKCIVRPRDLVAPLSASATVVRLSRCAWSPVQDRV